MKTFISILVVLALAAGGAWYVAGRSPGPTLQIHAPAAAIGPRGDLDLTIDTPQAKLDRLEVVLEQGETRIPIFTYPGDQAALLAREGDNRLRLTRPIGKSALPQLQAGKARLTVTAVRPVLFGYRHVESQAVREIDVRLNPPALAALSTFHYINLGGSEMVVYRVSPASATSGVRVGDYEYPGFPAGGAGIANADPELHVAFFALLWDQDPNTAITLFARDDVGNEAHAGFDYRVLPKTFRKSRITLDDRFLAKVVPPILQNTPELKVDNPSDLLGSFLRINGDLRRRNAEQIAALAHSTEPKILWHGAFKQLVNTAVEGSFADQRTYVYQGKDVDHQVHLGFDLASTAMAPVTAANSGKVVHAGWLGIYGNCVILDHGMGLQSLYAHLSSIGVKVGDAVNEGDTLGRSGSTGLAGGDHLHFTMLVGGHAVTPIDWWSAKWVEDRITRKLREAGAAVGAQGSGQPR
ncbi:MAG TPA: M23 family metallopeptidase [Steroidobacteraceae bacterium]|jgi:murein DD-endopeptidase MepM/ murein hydrolase activator NlpD|nr:M23 family metallopeptidase [Steroidobacteraceae bacterium]HVY83436.1 M23 family metallopeptidase [Steroidobacteraceae bacterium]